MGLVDRGGVFLPLEIVGCEFVDVVHFDEEGFLEEEVGHGAEVVHEFVGEVAVESSED